MPCMVPDAQLSTHFRLSEFVVSGVAERRGIANAPNDDQLGNLVRLADVLERVRRLLGQSPLLIRRGFSSPEVNAAEGDSRHSAHLYGCAADFIAPSFGTPREICARIADSEIAFDQLILEGSLVHLAVPILGEEPRRRVLTAVFQRGYQTRFIRGIV